MTTRRKSVDELDSMDSKNLKVNFLQALAESEMMLFRIKEFEVKDQAKGLNNLKNVLNYKGYSLEEIEVLKTDFQTKSGYCVVNNGMDVPLVNTTKPGIETTFWIKEDAVAVIRSLNEAVLNKIEEDEKEIIAAKEFIKEVIKNNLY